MNDRPRIGLIGVGAIGSRMARRLISLGHDVYVYDINPTTLTEFDPAKRGTSGAEIAARCDVILTCVTDAAAVRDVLLGKDGVITRGRPGQLVVDTTTSAPGTTRAVGESLSCIGVDFIDAPVSRGVPAADAGTLSVMVGGPEAVVDRAMPILRSIGTDIIWTGTLGMGHLAKALNMLVLAANLMVAAEVTSLVPHTYQSRRKLLSAINGSTARTFVTENHFEKYVLTESLNSGFTFALMRKDITIATDVGSELDVATPFGSRVKNIYEMAAHHGLGSKDNMEIVPYIGALTPAVNTVAYFDETFIDDIKKLLESVAACVTVEATLIASAAGLSSTQLLHVINASSGRSEISAGLEEVLEHNRKDGSSISAGGTPMKDLHNSCERVMRVARMVHKPMLFSSLMMDFISIATGRGISNTSYNNLVRLFQAIV